MRTLEDSLCDYKEFGFQTQFIPLDKIDTEDYNKGKALALKINLFNPGLGWWKLFEKYKTETKEALKCNPEIENYVATTISLIAKKVILIFFEYDLLTPLYMIFFSIFDKTILNL